MSHWLRLARLFPVALLLAGYAVSTPKWGKVFGMGDDQTIDPSAPQAFVEVDPGKPTGLRNIWRVSVARAPEEHRNHPGQVVVSNSDLFLGTFQGKVVRLNRNDGKVVWESDAGETIVGGVSADAQRVFAGTRNGEMLAFSRENGQELWRVRVSTSVASAPVVAEDSVVFLTLDNRTYALNGADGKQLWVHTTTPEPLVVMGAATPTVEGKRVYVGYSSGEVFSLSLERGAPYWSESLSVLGGRSELDLLQDVDASIVVSKGEGEGTAKRGSQKVYAVNHNGRAVALSARDGTRLWEQPVSAIRRPLLLYKQVIFSDMDGYLTALSADDGVALWRTRLTEGLLSAPVVMDEKIPVADDRGQLFSVDAASGRVLGLDSLGDAVLADPVVVHESLFLWTNEGDLLRYDF